MPVPRPTPRARFVAAAATLAAGAALPACWPFSQTSVWYVAVGAHARVPTSNGPCDTARASPAGPVDLTAEPPAAYTAVAPGRVRIPCRDGAVVLDVRAPARLAIDLPPQVTLGARTYARVNAYDARGASLDLGDDPDVVWTASPSLDPASRYTDFPVFGLPSPASFAFVPRAPGPAGVTATLGALRATATTTVAAAGAGP